MILTYYHITVFFLIFSRFIGMILVAPFFTMKSIISIGKISLTFWINCEEVEIKTDDASTSCSDWANKSHATVSGSEDSSAKIKISDGPAIESIPTSPKSCFLASATYTFPGPII